MKPNKQFTRSILSCGSVAFLAVVATGTIASAQTLVNRYSFSEANGSTNVTDSVGGPAWDGTVMGIVSNFTGAPVGGLFTGSQLVLQASGLQYVQLPAGILSTYTAVTIDVWATFGTLPSACFLYGFGDQDTNILSGGQASGFDYILCQPFDGRIAISDADPGWQHEEGTGGAGNLSGLTVHVTSVYNPSSGIVELYTNGVLVSRNTSINIPMSSVSNVLSYIGRSLYNADSYFDVSLDEFRIWNGALNPLQVAGSDVNGPDNASTSYGTVTGIQLTVPSFQLVQGTHESASVTAQASGIPNTVDISLLASYGSDKTNIIVVTNNVLYGVGQGSANITASFAGKTSTLAVTVVQPASVLTHRYSFSDPNASTSVADSVGGSAWNGTVMVNGTPPTTYPGNFSGTQLSITASNSEYVQLPAGIISNYSAVTLEAWATFPSALPGNCFFFGFGNTDGGGAGEDYIYLQPSAGHIGITGVDPGWQGPEDTCGTYGNLSLKTNIHIAAVFNPGASWIAVYTNGILAGKNTSTKWSLSQVSSVLNYLARSLYTGDSYMDVNLDEFRIYSGALTSQGIAISDAAGPDSIPASVTNGPGALQSLTLQVPSTLETPLTGRVKLLANYANLSNWDIVNNSVFPPAGLTITSSDTNVAYIGTDNLLHSKYPGVTTITAAYQGVTNNATVTVTSPITPVLEHRYNFSDANGSTSVADSVGGPTWNGTVMSGGTNAVPTSGNFANGSLSLSGAISNYVQLPGGILSNYTAVTIEAWASFGTIPGNAFFFGFGDTDTNGAGYKYIFCAPQAGAISITRSDPGWNPDQPAGGGGNFSNRTNLHVLAVFDPPAGYEALYTNGVLAAANTGINVQMSEITNVLSFVGRSLYNGDPYYSFSLDEFRIYNGVLASADIAATQLLGPDQVLTTAANVKATVSGGSVTLSWPAAAAGFTLMSKTSLSSGTWSPVSPVATLVGNQWQVTVPKSPGTKFFRLAR